MNFKSLNLKNFLLTLTVSLVFVGCSGLVTRGELKEADQKKTLQDQVSLIQRSHADQSNKFSDIDNDLRELTGRLEVLENKNHLSINEKEKLNKQNSETTQEQNRKIQLLQEELTRQDNQINMMMADINTLKSVISQQQAALKEESEKSKKDPYELAEDFFKANDWKKSILNYQKYRDSNPKGKHFADATYKIGVSFQELGMKDEAKSFFDEVITKFPNSGESKKAKTRIKNLKK